MKKRDLLLGVALLAGYSAQAVSSPYQGSVAGEGVYYLYQVETGKWLESNKKNVEQWTTHGELDDTGIDIELKKPDGFNGYQIWTNYTNNGSLNGAAQDRFFFDQPDRDVTDWIFEPVTVDGVTNAYKIMAKATPEGTGERSAIAADVYIGAADGELSDRPTDQTWQLVSREERLRVVKEQVKAGKGPVDVSWLLPWWQIDRNNLRDRQWTRNTVNEHGGGDGFDGPKGYPVKEFWHQIVTRYSYTLENLPEGTYGFSIQGYYRDTAAPDRDENMEAGAQLVERYLAGTELLRAKYFAGATSGTVMSIFHDAKSESTDGYTLEIPEAGKWLPNSMNDAGHAMINGAYKNDMLEVGVADGMLTVGFEKEEGEWRDWLVVGRFYLTYISEEVKGEDLTGLQNDLSNLIATATALPQTPGLINAIEEANKQLSEAKTSSKLLAAIDALQAVVNGVTQAKDAINFYNATKVLADAEGVDTANVTELFNKAVSRDDYNNALTKLRWARRRAARETQEDIYTGCAPVDGGEYYLYNLGQKQFLTAGSSWGAHAALGMPGVLCSFEIEDPDNNGFFINTHQPNGEDNGITKEYLNYRGYMDCARVDDFRFTPVEGKENVYYIQQNDYPDVHMAYNAEASVNDGLTDETTVGTECRNLDPNDLNAQWKLVSKADRDAQLAKATIDNPVDASYFISAPNFLQREDKSAWAMTGGPEMPKVWGLNENHDDFCVEAWNSTSADISQNIDGLPSGVYAVWVNGYYRNGDHANRTVTETTGEGDDAVETEKFIAGQPDNEKISCAWLQAGSDPEDDVALPNICTESGKAPGEGADVTATDGTAYHYPQYCDQAAHFFRLGLYKVHTVINYDSNETLYLALSKYDTMYEKDWMVADNFRLVYYGENTTKEEVAKLLDNNAGVEEIVVDKVMNTDNRIFNLQGIQVVNPTQPGIYIQNGKKFIVR